MRGTLKNLTQKQIETKVKIEFFARLFGVDPKWAIAIAMVESSLGLAQKSPTGCSGVFQMSTIAMKDLLLSMRDIDDDMVDIVCGIAFLRLLLKRWKTIEGATERFCDPNDRSFYLQRVLEFRYMDEQG
jgi:membrane-bound lytic murein transglycosylase MltF